MPPRPTGSGRAARVSDVAPPHGQTPDDAAAWLNGRAVHLPSGKLLAVLQQDVGRTVTVEVAGSGDGPACPQHVDDATARLNGRAVHLPGGKQLAALQEDVGGAVAVEV